MNQKSVRTTALNRKMEILSDIKKTVEYDIGTGKWFWGDRDETERTGPFDTFLQALNDAVEPYEHPHADGD